MLVFSAADFEDFRQPRPDMPADMEGELEEVVRILAQNRWPWRLHATYDETISRALDVFERVNQDIPLAGLHWFFDHAETISDQSIDRIARWAAGSRSSIEWRIKANISSSAMGAARQRPRRRSEESSKAASRSPRAPTRRASLPTTPGSRLPGWSPARPLAACDCIHTHNCLDRDTALRLWTENTTWFSNEEGKKGRIEVGQLADLIVPSRDFFACAEDEISGITSDLTLVGGKIVYGAGDFTPCTILRRRRPCPIGRRYDLWRVCGLGRPVLFGRGSGPAVACRHLQLRERLRHPWTRSCRRPFARLPVSDLRSFWGALGCSCFAF